MANILSLFGVKEKPNLKKGWESSLFYFIREFKMNPLPEEYEVIPVYREDKIVKYKIKKLAMDYPLFNSLMRQLAEENQKEQAELDKAKAKHG